MARRKREPEEALGPQVDGLNDLEHLENLFLPDLPGDYEESSGPESMEEQASEPVEPPVVLICGQDSVTEVLEKLAAECGFVVEIAELEKHIQENDGEDPQTDHVEEDFVSSSGINRNYYVCIFIEDPAQCENILHQCLQSEAAYVGVYADMEKRNDIYARLREDGVPDAELAAVCCPMGLNIGAQTPEQEAVAIMAELLGARAGTLKRLRYED